jgi:membrane peptidoglycan carboxypeptidase
MNPVSRVFHRLLALYIFVVWIIVMLVVARLVQQEVQKSKWQAHYLTKITKQLGFKLRPGVSESIRFPKTGPYDERLGYTLLPDAIARLEKQGFQITAQTVISPMMASLADNYGLFPIYHEKSQAGLRITDYSGELIFNSAYPLYNYPDFAAIPPLVLNTLLFIENRELLNEERVNLNPAIEWDRLGLAGVQMLANKVGLVDSVPGGSTLATQIEKYRHSPSGFTNSITDKFRQMSTASLRAYMQGSDTRAMRKEIALSYLNSMPLAATPRLGEIHGLGDGLSAWFNADFNQINKLLAPSVVNANSEISPEQALAYRQVLSILLSQRRPSYLLGKGFNSLTNLTDSYLRLMAEQGVISENLKNAALKVTVDRLPKLEATTPQLFTEKKTQTLLRTRLTKMLGVKSNYELDRIDLTVKTALDYRDQQSVTEALRQLNTASFARSAGIFGERMLDTAIDLAPVTYSLMLFERGRTGNMLRIQTDSYDQPLDINEGIRLDLGSTAKLRTMVHYLEVISDMYSGYKRMSQKKLAKLELHPRDHLSAWVVEQLELNPQLTRNELLNLALDKKYSASPDEYFYTGGGVHHFNNFTKDEDIKIMSVRHALRDSVNLVFIRLMRDLVYYHLYKPEGIARWLETANAPRRKEYLQKFADDEGRVYLQRFYKRYKDKTADEIQESLSKQVLAKPARLTMLYQALHPKTNIGELTEFLTTHLSKTALKGVDIEALHENYTIQNYGLQDRGFITKVHPLELWLARYMIKHPNASYQQMMTASSKQRQLVYKWLFDKHQKNAQRQRIMNLLEIEAFKEIHKSWQQAGYPFSALTPSYASSIGASGDRPAALAELVGILLNDGIKLPSVRFERLHFAKNTPYETLMEKTPGSGKRVIAPEVAKVAREALVGVVEGGTAGRLQGVYTDADGKPLVVGGKTGTGDHRKEIWGAGGKLIESRFISRAATFAFFIGDRFFGVITAYVQGPEAEQYHFTSSLPVQILKSLKPMLSPLINKTTREPDDKAMPENISGAGDG